MGGTRSAIGQWRVWVQANAVSASGGPVDQFELVESDRFDPQKVGDRQGKCLVGNIMEPDQQDRRFLAVQWRVGDSRPDA